MCTIDNHRRRLGTGAHSAISTALAVAIAIISAIAAAPTHAQEPDWGQGGTLHITQSLESHQNITLERPLRLTIDHDQTVSLHGNVSGQPGGIWGVIKNGAGRLELWGNNAALESQVALREGTLLLAGRHALGPDWWAALDAHAGTTLSYAPNATVAATLHLQDGVSDTPGAGYTPSAVQWRVDSGTAAHIGQIHGSTPLIKQGAGTLRLADAAIDPGGRLSIEEGTVQLDHRFSGQVHVLGGTQLTGAGQVGQLNVGSAGTLAPNGRLTVYNTLTFEPDSQFQVRTWADGRHDSVDVHGHAGLDGHVLVLPQDNAEHWQRRVDYTIVQTKDGVGASQFASVESALPYLEPHLAYGSHDIVLSLQPRDTTVPPHPDPDPNPNPDPRPDPDPDPKPDPDPDPDPDPTPPPSKKPKKPKKPKTPKQPDPKPTVPTQPEPDPEPTTPAQPEGATPSPAPAPVQEPDPDTNPEPEHDAEPGSDTVRIEPSPLSPPAPPPPPVVMVPTSSTAFQNTGWAASVRNRLTDDSHFLRDAVYSTATAAAAANTSSNTNTNTSMHANSGTDTSGFWARAFHSSGEFRDTDATARVDRRISGLLLGVGRKLTPNWQAGVMLGGSRTHADGTGHDGVNTLSGTAHSSRDVTPPTPGAHARIESTHAGIYAHGTGAAGTTLITGASYSWHRIKSQRDVHTPAIRDTFGVRYRAQTAQVFTEVAHPLNPSAWQNTTIEPFARAAWVHTRVQDATESGGALAVSIQGERQSVLFTELGLRARHRVHGPLGDATLDGALSWQHAHGDIDSGVSQYFRDDVRRTTFDARGVPIHRNTWRLRLGLNADLGKRSQLSVGYVGQHGNKVHDHGVQVGLQFKW